MFVCYLFQKCVYILVKAKRQEVESLNEKHLITKLKKRSQKALDQLISSYSAYVYTIARNILGGAFTAEDAEEITSDVFFRIWQTADSLDETRSISPYLAACTRNCAINKLRSKGKDMQCGELMEDILSCGDIENDMENAEQLAIISDGLERLSKQDKEIFIRFYYYGERLAAISGKMGITENTCKTRLSRTRKKLREYLAERGYKNEKNDNWSQSFAPLNTAECDPVRIAGSVREKINAEKGRNITMKTNKRRIKPLVIAAAVAATSAVSMVSVNAATDGQLVEKISLFINGKEQDIDNSNIKKGVDENGDQYYEFHVNEDTDSEVSVELRGDVSDADDNGIQHKMDVDEAE